MTRWSEADRRLTMAERAAIMEIDGGVPRQEAERRARHIAEGMLAGETPAPAPAAPSPPAEQLGFETADEGFRQWKSAMERLTSRI